MAASSAYKRVYLQGIDISASVRSVEVEDNDRLIDRAVVVMNDSSGAGAEAPREGNTLLVDMGWSDNHAVLFEGELIQVGNTAQGCDPKTVTLTALDLSYRIRKRPFQATNHVGTLSAIVQAIVTRDPAAGITIGQIAPGNDPTFTAQAPLRQTTQNDWDFIMAMAARYTCRAFVEYNGGASKFYFVAVTLLTQGDSLGTLSQSGMSGRLTRFSYERLAAQADALRTTAVVDPVSGTPVTSPDPVQPTEPPHTPSPAAAQAGGSQLDNALSVMGQATDLPQSQRPQRFVAGTPSDPARATTDATQDPTRALGFIARGACVGAVMLRAKGQVDVAGVSGWASGRWYVRKARHVVRTTSSGGMAPGYTTEFELTR